MRSKIVAFFIGDGRGPFFDDGFPKSFLQGIHSKASLGIAVAFGKDIFLIKLQWDQVADG